MRFSSTRAQVLNKFMPRRIECEIFMFTGRVRVQIAYSCRVSTILNINFKVSSALISFTPIHVELKNYVLDSFSPLLLSYLWESIHCILYFMNSIHSVQPIDDTESTKPIEAPTVSFSAPLLFLQYHPAYAILQNYPGHPLWLPLLPYPPNSNTILLQLATCNHLSSLKMDFEAWHI